MKYASDIINFIKYIVILLFSGSILFLLSLEIFDNFKKLYIELSKHYTEIPLWAWTEISFVTVVFGVVWFVAFIFFEYAKKGIVDLMHKKTNPPKRVDAKSKYIYTYTYTMPYFLEYSITTKQKTETYSID